MRHTIKGSLLALPISLLAFGAVGCGGAVEANSNAFGSGDTKITAKRFADGSIDDQGKCEWQNRKDREANETWDPLESTCRHASLSIL